MATLLTPGTVRVESPSGKWVIPPPKTIHRTRLIPPQSAHNTLTGTLWEAVGLLELSFDVVCHRRLLRWWIRYPLAHRLSIPYLSPSEATRFSHHQHNTPFIPPTHNVQASNCALSIPEGYDKPSNLQPSIPLLTLLSLFLPTTRSFHPKASQFHSECGNAKDSGFESGHFETVRSSTPSRRYRSGWAPRNGRDTPTIGQAYEQARPMVIRGVVSPALKLPLCKGS